MRKFKDRSGREWMLDITVLTVERVKAECGVDMPGLFGDRMQGLDALLADPMKLTGVIVACGCPGNGTVDELRAEWDGATADAAVECWLEELIGFFPDARKRQALTQALASLREMGAQIAELATSDLSPEKVSEQALSAYKQLKASLSASASGQSSGNSPDSSDSTPGPSPSAN